jgi:mono/diheme cytochrome c family protein
VSSPLKFIFEALFILLILFISIKVLQFLYTAQSSKNTASSLADIEEHQSNSTRNTAGRTLFTQNCASCHALNKIIIGPPLAGIENRIQDKKLLIEWIRNNQKVLRSGNRYFNALLKEYNGLPMSIFTNLTEAEIQSILDYLNQSKGPIN